MKFRFLSLSLLLGLSGPWPAWAQAAGKSSAAASIEPVAAVDAPAVEPGPQRSALWQAVEAGRHPAPSAGVAQDRRLTPEQRLELRHQVRQAWERADASQSVSTAEPAVARP